MNHLTIARTSAAYDAAVFAMFSVHFVAALFLPLITAVALAIKANNCGPVLNRRVCICHNNRRIQRFEFRTKANCSREVRGYQFLRWIDINTLREAIVFCGPT
ncbi:MAG TPA: hypothetical protein VHG31_07205 [Stellaceae bacterium]|nr:hypothetical protein [Stellaceae bacterium]